MRPDKICALCKYKEDLKINSNLSGELLFYDSKQLCDEHYKQHFKLNKTDPEKQKFTFHNVIADINDSGCYCKIDQCIMFKWTHELYNIYASWASFKGKCRFCDGNIHTTDIILTDGTVLDKCECGRYYYSKLDCKY